MGYPFERNLKRNWKCIFCIFMQKKKQKREDTVSQYQSVRSFVCSHDVYGFSQQVSSLYKYYVLTHCSFIHFFFLLRCFDQSTVIIVTMFSKQINERLQMNERSGKAMNGNLSGFYWTYLVLLFLFFFLNVKSFCADKIHKKNS